MASVAVAGLLGIAGTAAAVPALATPVEAGTAANAPVANNDGDTNSLERIEKAIERGVAESEAIKRELAEAIRQNDAAKANQLGQPKDTSRPADTVKPNTNSPWLAATGIGAVLPAAAIGLALVAVGCLLRRKRHKPSD